MVIIVVVYLPLWKNMSSSVGMMTFPRYGKIKFMFQTTNQYSSSRYISRQHMEPRSWPIHSHHPREKVWKLLTRTSKEGDILRWGCPQRYLFVCLVHSNKYGILQYNTVYSSVPTNRHESTNTNRNEPRGHGTGKWKRTAGTEPQICRNRTENHNYIILIWFEKQCKNDYISYTLPPFNKRFGLRHLFSRVTNP